MYIEKVKITPAVRGDWRIEKFTTDMQDWSSMLRGRAVPIGEEFTRLMRGGTLVMSDTPSEMRDLYEPVRFAQGTCLINGLGLGVVLQAILNKPNVTDVTVVEISKDVLDLVASHYCDERVRFVCADAFAYMPRGRYEMVWHDIWDNICADNLEGMERLHLKYERRARWQGSWCRQECERGR